MENMNNENTMADNVSKTLKDAGLYPIAIHSLNENNETRYFAGSLEEFIEAAKALGAKAIFTEELFLEEEEFYYKSAAAEDEDCDCGCGCCCDGDCCDCDCDDDCECKCECGEESAESETCQCEDVEGDDDSDVDAIAITAEDLDGLDLSLLRPEISKYDEYVGSCCGVRLIVPGVDHLETEIFAEWYEDFAELVDEASEELEADPEKALGVIEERSEEQQ